MAVQAIALGNRFVIGQAIQPVAAWWPVGGAWGGFCMTGETETDPVEEGWVFIRQRAGDVVDHRDSHRDHRDCCVLDRGVSGVERCQDHTRRRMAPLCGSNVAVPIEAHSPFCAAAGALFGTTVQRQGHEGCGKGRPDEEKERADASSKAPPKGGAPSRPAVRSGPASQPGLRSIAWGTVDAAQLDEVSTVSPVAVGRSGLPGASEAFISERVGARFSLTMFESTCTGPVPRAMPERGEHVAPEV